MEDYKPKVFESGRNDGFYWEIDITENKVYIWIESGGERVNLEINRTKSGLKAKAETHNSFFRLID